ncbi:MAG TPA: phospho-sugar mutase, partial [Mycobacteriales bacterium]|nr:phospho-sugar mutase [Mycobacteriales bacterium]
AAVADRFAGRLAFGTAGLRGPLRAGPNGMNRAVVRRTAAGLAAWLTRSGATGPVVIGFDARHGSADFAADSAAVLAGAGLDARLLPAPLPTPVLAHAVRLLGAAAGVMVTASHNPPQDNGYKVYAADGAQIVPPADREIEAAITAVGPLSTVPMSYGYKVLGHEVLESYLDSVAAVPRTAHRRIRTVHTALHGVGAAVLHDAFARAGFEPPVPVTEQAEPDPDFPTVPFPNPEEPGALDLALALAERTGADLLLASDPDADRCAVAIPDDTGWRALSGDELGVLLADHLIRTGRTGTYATTIVSSSLLGALCRARGVPYAETLTGFKWIVRAGDDLTFGYEEALGYCVMPDVVKDKDGISAALLAADLAAALKAEGRTLQDRLDELAAEFGTHATAQVSVRVADLSRIADTMAALRADPPGTLLGRAATAEDLLPATDGLRWRADGVRVVVRPSGTEPKLKAYLEVVTDSRESAAAALDRLRAELEPRLR